MNSNSNINSSNNNSGPLTAVDTLGTQFETLKIARGAVEEQLNGLITSLDELLVLHPNSPELTRTVSLIASTIEANISMNCAVEDIVRAVSGKIVIEGEPDNLVLERHGRSVANERGTILNEKKDAQTREEFIRTPNFRHRLIQIGRDEADTTGLWMKDQFSSDYFHAGFCPNFNRSKETGARSAIQAGLEIMWRVSSLFGERNWGGRMELLDKDEQNHEYQRRMEDVLGWAAPGGETMLLQEVLARLAMGTFHRKYNQKNVYVSSHGEKLISFRSVIERLPLERVEAMIDEGPPNGGIVHYTRINPETGERASHINWVRLMDPSNPENVRAGEKWDGEWRRIERPEYTSEELLKMVEKEPQIYDRDKTGITIGGVQKKNSG